MYLWSKAVYELNRKNIYASIVLYFNTQDKDRRIHVVN